MNCQRRWPEKDKVIYIYIKENEIVCGYLWRKVKEKENKKIRTKRMSGEKRCGPHCKEQVGHQ